MKLGAEMTETRTKACRESVSCLSKLAAAVLFHQQHHQHLSTVVVAALSPMSSLAENLGSAGITTPKTGYRNAANRPPSSIESGIESSAEHTIDGSTSNCSALTTSLFLNSAGRSPATRRAEQHDLGVLRRARMAPSRILQDHHDTLELDDATPKKVSPLEPIEELSFYDGNSPQQSPLPCQIDEDMESELSPETSPTRYITHTPFKEDDCNSNGGLVRYVSGMEDSSTSDSGIGMMSQFTFVPPCGMAPPSRKTPRKSPSSRRLFSGLSSTASIESVVDEDLYAMDDEMTNDDQCIPNNFSSLLSGSIKAVRNSPPVRRQIYRRSLSLTIDATSTTTPQSAERIPMQLLQGDANTPNTTKGTFKRPEPPCISPSQCKRLKYDTAEENAEESENANIECPVMRTTLKKCATTDSATIMRALHRSNTMPDLIGDFSKPLCLPMIDGRHQDLNSISTDTMAALLRGQYKNTVSSYTIIDCRYPYEFEGGHIRGACNVYLQEELLERFITAKTSQASSEENAAKRHVLIFHCEFSSERGPKLSRFLRSNDRVVNADVYPALHYPEMYLLHGGYKDFYAAYPELCDPNGYRQMTHPDFTEEYKNCRCKCRTWSGDPKGSAVKGTLTKSRSRLYY